MKRREFIGLLVGAVTAPISARAQSLSRPRTVAILAPTRSLWLPWNAAFLERLRELGWAEGGNIAIEYGWAEGDRRRFSEIASEFARRNVDVIVTFGSAVPAAKAATSTIPIVFPIANDPVGGGIVESLSRPGGNVTGLSVQAGDLAGKRIELLREVRPGLRRVAVIYDIGYREGALVVEELEAIARKLGIQLVRLGIHSSEQISSVLADLDRQADGLYVIVSAVVAEGAGIINQLAIGAGIPTMYNTRDYVLGGGFMSYGPHYPELFRRTAEIVDKILRGAKPADIPVEQPTKFEFVVNLKVARALGIDIPSTLLARADEVIE